MNEVYNVKKTAKTVVIEFNKLCDLQLKANWSLHTLCNYWVVSARSGSSH